MHSHRQPGARDGPVTLGWLPLPPSSRCAAASGGSRPLRDKQGSAVSGAEAMGPGRPPAARPCLPAGTEAMARAGRWPVRPGSAPCCNREGRGRRQMNDSPGRGRQNPPTRPPRPRPGERAQRRLLDKLQQTASLQVSSRIASSPRLLQGIRTIPQPPPGHTPSSQASSRASAPSRAKLPRVT